jgi:hypothetical protein
MLDSLSPQRRRVVLGTAALAVLLVVTLIAIAVVRGMAGAVDPVPQDRPGPGRRGGVAERGSRASPPILREVGERPPRRRGLMATAQSLGPGPLVRRR